MSTTADRSSPGECEASGLLRAPVGNDVELCYQTFGDPDDEPLLLVMGLGGPLTWWPESLCRLLASMGFHVIRYDNRDAGRSTRMRGRVGRGSVVQAFLGLPVRTPYTLVDMAADGFGLLDHLEIDSAHLAGVSMGGMIVQSMALAEPTRVRSLTSISSTTGRRGVGWQHPSLLPTLLGGAAPDRETYAERSVETWGRLGSPAYPATADALRARARETWDHGLVNSGTLRQMLAILTQPDRTVGLGGVEVPTLVVHGLADKLVHVSGGRATAAAVPDAELVLLQGMGHDLPEPLHPVFAGAIRRVADRA
ncbi:alpha/beta fold hydrolase [Nocardioides acrostichi]|uniref:Alpha/beta hydrolase n=1 Tax=Nocardioides acrostichi TaxID=2784339 RepID=A0A930V4B2_9ACTN|nr:alpha/beta hydrolase [Nocardioides acrostichi]MBF4163591.1 alpha/beta hydrolase [Nocardioides acrostichi]